MRLSERGSAIRAAYRSVQSRFRPSNVPAVRTESGDLKVLLSMPRWTVYRSTDRHYVFEGFARLSEKFRIEFIAIDSLAYLGRWNTQYLLRRLKDSIGRHLEHESEAPSIPVDASTRAVFAYGLYPRGEVSVPVLWEQTFAPQWGVDEKGWKARLRGATLSCAERAASIVTATDVSAEWFSQIFPEHAHKIRTIPYYLPDLDGSLVRPPIQDGAVRLVFVGKQARRKGLDTFVAAWPLISAGVRKRLRVAVVSALVDGAVSLPPEWHYSDFVPDVLELMRSSDVLVFPTKHEAYGLVLAEGMAAGCAVITTDAPIQRAIVGPHAGLFVDPTSPEALARAIESFATDRRQLAQAQAAARSRFELTLHPDVVGRAYVDLLFEIAGASSPVDIWRAGAKPRASED